MLKKRGAHIVLGVRDVMDDPALLRREWERKGAADALLRHYDDIVVYGLRSFHEPLASLGLPEMRRDSASATPAICGAICRSSPISSNIRPSHTANSCW